MTTTPALVNPGAFLGTGDSNLYTVPANTSSIITKFTLTNTTSSAVTATIYLSDTNTVGSASLLQSVVVSGFSTYQMTAANHNMGAGASFLGHADTAGAVIVKISAVQIS